jgi:hypothetical protein
LFETIDIFTPSTGVAVIPIDRPLTEISELITVGHTTMRVAKPSILIATQTNPFALTPDRKQRMLYLLVSLFAERGHLEYHAQLKEAIDYIGRGGQKVQQMLQDDPTLAKVKAFSAYDREVKKFAKSLTSMKSRMNHAAAALGLSAKNGDDARDLAYELFMAYRTPELTASASTASSPAA